MANFSSIYAKFNIDTMSNKLRRKTIEDGDYKRAINKHAEKEESSMSIESIMRNDISSSIFTFEAEGRWWTDKDDVENGCKDVLVEIYNGEISKDDIEMIVYCQDEAGCDMFENLETDGVVDYFCKESVEEFGIGYWTDNLREGAFDSFGSFYECMNYIQDAITDPRELKYIMEEAITTDNLRKKEIDLIIEKLDASINKGESSFDIMGYIKSRPELSF